MKATDDSKRVDIKLYQSAVGCLLYLYGWIRPDIAYSVSSAVRFCSDPMVDCCQAHFRYLQGTKSYGLEYSKGDGGESLVGFSDADWDGDSKNQKSTSGYVFVMNGVALGTYNEDGVPSNCCWDQASRVLPYQLPHTYRDMVEKEIKEMLDSGVIESSSTEWPSPFVLVDQKMALFGCVDDRQLNTETLANAYPMPKIDDLINRHLTAFTTPFGLFQFRMMPFGLHWAPSTFQWLLDKNLQGLEDYAAVAYIDDDLQSSRSAILECPDVRTWDL
eukprot:Em0008g125a